MVCDQHTYLHCSCFVTRFNWAKIPLRMEIDRLLAVLSADQKKLLHDFIAQFVTHERQALIDKVLPYRTRRLAVVLENIYQPHNASAVLRSCDLFGVQDVYIIETKYEYQVNRDIALGSAQWLTLHRYQQPGRRDLAACAADLRAAGYTLAATTLRPGSVPLNSVPVHQKIALLFGTEQHGLSDEAHDLADTWVHIPMMGFTQSFNISVSAALCLYELSNKVRQSDVSWSLPPAEARDIKIGWLLNSATRPEALLLHFIRQHKIEGDFSWLKTVEEKYGTDQSG